MKHSHEVTFHVLIEHNVMFDYTVLLKYLFFLFFPP